MPKCAHLGVFATPIRHGCDPTCSRIVPLVVGAATAAWQFLAAQCVQLAGDLTVSHATTAVSIQKGVWKSSATRSSIGGSGRPRSS